MKAKMVDLKWKKCSPARCVSGIKGGYRPPQAVAGGYGTFIVIDEPAQIHIVMEDEHGRRYDSGDIISDIRRIMCWQKITENRVNQLRSALSNRVFEIDSYGRIYNLAELLLS